MTMKRTRYRVYCPGDHVAQFSSHRQALLFAEFISREPGAGLIEVAAPDGLVGQYRRGIPTPEFEQHHISSAWHCA